MGNIKINDKYNQSITYLLHTYIHTHDIVNHKTHRPEWVWELNQESFG
jgi:hypothetical protein